MLRPWKKNWYSLAKILILFLLLMGLILPLPFSFGAKAQETMAGTVPTLSDQAFFTGHSDPNSAILVTVYYFPGGRDRMILYQSRQLVGSTGLYAIEVPIPLIGTQYVSLEIGGEKSIYEYVRYPASLSRDISEYQLNIYDFLLQEGGISP